MKNESKCEIRDEEEVVVPGNSSANVVVVSERGPFRAMNIVVPPDVAVSFMVTDVKVGTNSQFVASSAVASELLHRGAPARALPLRTCSLAGGPMVLSVTNHDSEARLFKATIIGRVGLMADPREDLRQESVPGCSRVTRRHSCEMSWVSEHLVTTLQRRCRRKSCFKPELLVVPAEVLADLRVQDVRVVGESALSPPGEVSPGVWAVVGGATMQVADFLAVSVKNGVHQERAFCGTVVGTIVA